MLAPNDKIGPYTLIKFLGRGGFAEVWLAEKQTHIATTKCALKIPIQESVDLDAIKKDAATWEQAKGHPNVLPIIDADIYDGQIVIASEYAPDGSLNDWLKRHDGKAPSIESAVKMLDGLLAGLEHLHSREQPIIHRDLKPANILLQGEIPRLADFGLARLIKATQNTQTVAGTPLYMSPETLRGKRTEQSDLWSAAVIFYHLLLGGFPFNGNDDASIMVAILTQEAKALPGSIPAPLRDFVTIALNKEASARYQTAKAMRSELQKAYQSSLQFGYAPTLVLPESKSQMAEDPLIVVPEITISVDELEKRRQRDGFILIPAGQFMMGSDEYQDEKPIHQVRISRPFEMAKYEVTQEQWQTVMDDNPGAFKGEANLPVEQVSWDDVQEFILRMNARKDGYVYRLPTEAEWEYACRAGTTGDYAGDLDEMAWYSDNSDQKTHPVGEKMPNAWGLYDMHGNVWEWCRDWYADDYYKQSPNVDPTGSGTGSDRVIRGGGWGSAAQYLRSANRDGDAPAVRGILLGFRLVRTHN
jgi:formylglycine-generating enzyme required for sulfatase activity/tRNA A-37 threonylcarbamoyl transferase component Bud32